MSLGSHLNELRKKHEILSKKIEEQQKSPAVDDIALAELKRQKLQLKDEIHRINQDT